MGNKPTLAQQEDLEKIKKETGLTIPLLEDLYRRFEKLAEKDGFIYRPAIKQMIKDVYNTDNSVLVSAVFNLYDRENRRKIDFKDFAMATSLLVKPGIEDDLELTFKSYDLNNDGQITRGELKEVFLTKAKIGRQRILGNEAQDIDNIHLDPSEAQLQIDEADKTFQKLDIRKQGVISKQVFLEVMQTDPDLKASITNFLVGYLGKEPQTKIKMLTLRRKQAMRKEIPYDKQIFDYVTSEEAEKEQAKKSVPSSKRNKSYDQKLPTITDDSVFIAPETGMFTDTKAAETTSSPLKIGVRNNTNQNLQDLDSIVNNLQAVVNDKKT